MPNTKITREGLKNHLHYGKWIYIAIALVAFFVGEMAFTMTEYRPPKERKVDFEIVGAYINSDPVQQIADEILSDAASIDPTLEAIDIYSIQYSGDPETDIYGAQKYTVMMAAQEGDLYLVNRELMEQIVAQGGAMPLDEFIDRGLIDVDGLDLSAVTLDEPVEEGAESTGKRHVYAIPASDLVRLSQVDISYSVEDKYFVLMWHSANPETSLKVLQRMRARLQTPASGIEIMQPLPSEQPLDPFALPEAPPTGEGTAQ